MKPVIVGTRGSRLSLCQTQEVVEQLKAAHLDREFQVLPIKTGGDISAEKSLVGMGRGIFVKEIEEALYAGRIDLAVHSLKDMPTRLPDGLTIGAVCWRVDPRDVLVDRWACPLGELPPGARIGTSSPRRAAQLKEARPDVEVLPIRGNVETRMTKAEGEEYDGAILAAAGLLRLGIEHRISETLAAEQFVPAPGQGALAIEARVEDDETVALLSPLEDDPTRSAVTAERAFLEALGGGCQVPVGAYGSVEGDLLTLTVYLASADGAKAMRATVRGRATGPHEVGMDAYRQLMEQGAKAIIAS